MGFELGGPVLLTKLLTELSSDCGSCVFEQLDNQLFHVLDAKAFAHQSWQDATSVLVEYQFDQLMQDRSPVCTGRFLWVGSPNTWQYGIVKKYLTLDSVMPGLSKILRRSATAEIANFDDEGETWFSSESL